VTSVVVINPRHWLPQSVAPDVGYGNEANAAPSVLRRYGNVRLENYKFFWINSACILKFFLAPRPALTARPIDSKPRSARQMDQHN
jgi:hypothetical protein